MIILSCAPVTNTLLEDVKNPNKIYIDSIGLYHFNFQLDHTTYFDAGYTNYFILFYDDLVQKDLDDDSKYSGLLAESWTITQNRMVNTFNLKQNVMYHDGTPFDGFNFQYISKGTPESVNTTLDTSTHKGNQIPGLEMLFILILVSLVLLRKRKRNLLKNSGEET